MRFIPKKKEVLTEADANPLDVNSVDLSYDEQYVQAIMKAVASESGAIVEYEQILAIEPHVTTKSLIDIFHDTLEDIKNEEIKHISQLNAKLSEAPSLKDGYKDGEEEADSGIDKESDNVDKNEDFDKEKEDKEEKQEESEDNKLTESIINEAIPSEKSYSTEEITQLISSKYQLNDEQYKDIMNSFSSLDDEIDAETIDAGLNKICKKYDFTPEEKEEIENLIITQATDLKGERKREFKEDIGFDIGTLENLLDEFNTYAARWKIEELINELKTIKYDGNKHIGWNQHYHKLDNEIKDFVN